MEKGQVESTDICLHPLDTGGVLEGVRSGDFGEGLLRGTRREGLVAVGEGVVEVLSFFVLILKGWGGGFAGVPLAAVAKVAAAGCPFLADLLMGRTPVRS